MKDLPLFGQVFCFIAIIAYKYYSELVEGPDLVAIFKNNKKNSDDIDRKNDEINTDKKDMKKNKKNNKDSTIDTKSIIDHNVNVVNFEEAYKNIKETTSVFLVEVGKKVNNVDKNAKKVKKEVGNASKNDKKVRKEVSDVDKDAEDIISDFP